MLNLIEEGGFIMVPLLIFSIISLAIALERMWFFHSIRTEVALICEKMEDLLQENKINEAKGLALAAHPILRSSLRELFTLADFKKEKHWEDRLNRRYQELRNKLKGQMWVVGTVGSSAPFIGLFGTVVGIIKAFASMAASGRGGFAIVAAGLSEALIATAAGIIVAVIAVILYNFLLQKWQHLGLLIKHRLEDMSDQFKEGRPSDVS